MGPVDYLVIEFPAGKQSFTGRRRRARSPIRRRDHPHHLDLLIIKNESGSIDAMEIDDIEGLDEIRQLESSLAILAADDVDMLAAAMEQEEPSPRTGVGEHVGSAVRVRRTSRRRPTRRHGAHPAPGNRCIHGSRTGPQDRKGTDMPLGPEHQDARRCVLARTAAVVGGRRRRSSATAWTGGRIVARRCASDRGPRR